MAVALLGEWGQPSVFGLLIAAGGVLAFGIRLRNRQKNQNPRWSSGANWAVNTLIPVIGVIVFGLVGFAVLFGMVRGKS